MQKHLIFLAACAVEWAAAAALARALEMAEESLVTRRHIMLVHLASGAEGEGAMVETFARDS